MSTTAVAKNPPVSTPIAVWQRPWLLAVLAGLVAILWRIPFVFRYDLNFQTEYGACYLMAKKILNGDFPVYFWESDYMGTLPSFLTAAFFALFGSSIELAAFVSVLIYAAAVGIGVYIVQNEFGRLAALVAGISTAIGVPYSLHYMAEPAGGGYVFAPFLGVLFVWLGIWIYRQGWNIWRAILTGFIVGHCWYYNKQSLIGIVTVATVLLIDERGRSLIKQLVTGKGIIFLFGAALIGYLPELVYKMLHSGPARLQMFGFASGVEMTQSAYWVLRVLPAYFNGDPLGRIPEGVHYLQHNPRLENLPGSPVDYLGIVAGWAVVFLIAVRLVKSWKQHNAAVMILAAYPLINITAVIVSKVAVGEYYAPKRYLFTSAILFLLWMGIFIAEFWEKRKLFPALILTLVIPLAGWDQLKMLRMPDELRDYRQVVRQIHDAGYQYGITWYTYCFSLIAISDEQLILSCIDYNDHPPYRRMVEGRDALVLVHPGQMSDLPHGVNIFGYQYHRDGASHLVGELGWTVYRKTNGNAP